MTQYSYAATNTTNPASSTTFGSARVTPDVQISNPEVGSGALDPVGLPTVVLALREVAAG